MVSTTAPLRAEPPDGPGGALLWAAAFATAILAHLALGAFVLARIPEPSSAAEDLPAVQIDMAPPASAPVDTPIPARPQESVPASAAPDPVMEEVPDVPDPDVPPPTPLLREARIDEKPVPAPLDIPLPELPPPAVVPPNPAVVLPPPPKSVAVPKPPKPPDRQVAETRPRRVKAEERAERRVERRPAAEAAGMRSDSTVASVSSGASAAASAAWRSQLVAYLQSRLHYPPGAVSTGAAGVAFSVTRGGQVSGASLTRSSGNPTLDAAALAVFRGAVPPPPAGYSGTLSFNIPIRFTQR